MLRVDSKHASLADPGDSGGSRIEQQLAYAWVAFRRHLFHVTLFVVAVCLTTGQTMMAPLSKNDDGQYEYSKPSAVFLAELIKLTLSLAMLLVEYLRRKHRKTPPPDNEPPLIGEDVQWQALKYTLPAILYFTNNNLTFYIVQGISPATNQAVSQSKIIFTAILLFFCLGRRFNLQQVASLAILICALVILSIDDEATNAPPSTPPPASDDDNATTTTTTTTMLRLAARLEEGVGRDPLQAAEQPALAAASQAEQPPLVAAAASQQLPLVAAAAASRRLDEHDSYPLDAGLAVMLSILVAFLGACAGVANEFFLKRINSTIFWQNILSYSWGVLFNLAFMFIDGQSRDILMSGGLFNGYNMYAYLYAVLTALMGLSISFMFKYQDNIARILALAVSIGATYFISAPALGSTLTFAGGFSVLIIALTIVTYYDGAEKQQLAAEEQKRAAEGAAGEQQAAKESTGLLEAAAPPPASANKG